MKQDDFVCCDLERLLKWILAEERAGSIFGIRRELFFKPSESDPFRMMRYGRMLQTPIGVAAGPHTQLSQNIISAWLTGARYIELKTIQVLDELNVTKPCIDMTDEGYNCEWSQELKLDRSFDEYLNALLALHILNDKFGWAGSDEPGFIFNMSVGYNLEGIQSSPVQRFLDRMLDCPDELAEKIDIAARVYPKVRDLGIPAKVSDNVTISTMHGCPPDEVEKIGRYFIEDRRLNTTIKLNPTLLGPDRVRRILNDDLGFGVDVPSLAFDHDLKYDDGLALIRNLRDTAENLGVEFNLKLTNTLETTNKDQNLPDSEAMVYMSGRPLHPISINLAARLQDEFDGELDISFSAGVDCFNVADVLACGLNPITICSDALKPGGYGRLSQYLEMIAEAMADVDASTLDDFAENARENLKSYTARVAKEERYAKRAFSYQTVKTDRPLPLFDCAAAPCISGCPAEQDIPTYLAAAARGDLDAALKTILATNPFPNVQGKVCDHPCQLKCTRMNYDAPLLIRELKRFVAENHEGPAAPKPGEPNGQSAAIIGGGPAGLSCAYFLSLAGFKVEIFETKPFAGGMAADGIPVFRLDEESLKKDIDAILALGVTLNADAAVTKARFADLVEKNDFVYVAVGARESADLKIPGIDAGGVFDQLAFLSAVRRGNSPHLGTDVAVIGGGNSAIDAARTAKRLVGPEGLVTIVYRRTQKEMPADHEEIQAALDEGIALRELCAPERVVVKDGRVSALTCVRMELSEPDESGRPWPIPVENSEFDIPVDTLIPAIGQLVDLSFFPEGRLQVNPGTLETQMPNVFAGGDALRGASSLVRAIGDGRRAANAIIAKANTAPKANVSIKKRPDPDWTALQVAQARRLYPESVPEKEAADRLDFNLYVETLDEDAAAAEASRCLQCDVFCNVCTTVCPNRANVAFEMVPISYPRQTARMENGEVIIETVETVHIDQHFQIVNLADFCNECGNCATFCPSAGAPYRDKARFHLTRESYDASAAGYFFTEKDKLVYKNGDHSAMLTAVTDGFQYEDGRMTALLDKTGFSARNVVLKDEKGSPVALKPAVEMAVLFENVRSAAVVSNSF